jgi:acetyl-CoA carboxylase biotin carboxylase subunit
MEKFVEEPRHIEIQVAGDQYGTLFVIWVNEIVRFKARSSKIVEESVLLLL